MRASWIAAALVLAAIPRSTLASAEAAPPVQSGNVILVQSAGAAESHWAKMIPLLEAAGLRVTAVEVPPGSLEAAVAEARRVLALQDGPSVLVGDGWDGAVVSAAGVDSKASALVYLAGVAPEASEDFAALSARFPPQPSKTSFVSDKTVAVAWRERPTFYAVAQKGQAISPELQRFYAARMNAKTIVLDAGAESHPREIAGLILEAAGVRPPACGAEGDNGIAACAAPALPRSLMKGCKCTKGSLEDLTAP